MLYGGILWALITLAGFAHAIAQCFRVRTGEHIYSDDVLLERFIPWVLAGAPESADFLEIGDQIELLDEHDPTTAHVTCQLAYIGVFLGFAALGDNDDTLFDSLSLTFYLPWEYLVRSAWPIFGLIDQWSRTETSSADRFLDRCDKLGRAFWTSDVAKFGQAAFEAASSQDALHNAVEAVANRLLGHVDPIGWRYAQTLCTALPGLFAVLLLSLVRKHPSISTAYAIRLSQEVVQQYIQNHGEREVAITLASVPWPLFRILSHIAMLEKTRIPDLEHITVKGDAPSQNLPASQLPAFAIAHDARLLDALRVTHRFLQLLGVQYIAIAGTLLGALRHFGPIPWDDDADLCVDANHEATLFSVAAGKEAKLLGADWGGPLSWHSRRALQHLEQENHLLTIYADRALIFRVTRKGDESQRAGVDIWQCWGFDDRSKDEIPLMSLHYGPKVPRQWIFPRQKLPFGALAVWGPAEPDKVTGLYFSHGGFKEDWRTVCRGRKVHEEHKTVEYADTALCNELAAEHAFAGPWQSLDVGPHIHDARATLSILIDRHLPGIRLLENSLVVQAAKLGFDQPLRLQASLELAIGDGSLMSCRALFWNASTAEEDLLAPGAVLLMGAGDSAGFTDKRPAPIRSFVCRSQGGHDGEAHKTEYVWEDLAL